MQMGHGNFCWFTGVVEDRIDPLQLGRVRVRIFSLHSEERIVNERTGQGIPVDELPWATPIRPITSAAMDGIGDAPVGIVEGTWVVGFARDESMNDLFVLGTIGGIPEDPPKDNEGKKGFVDPRTEAQISSSPRKINKEESRDPSYPKMKIPMGRYPQEKFLKQPDVNRLARGKDLDKTLLKQKKDNRKKNISTANGSKWSEISSPYSARYPYNHVKETESGHVIEFDDTPGSERIHIWHKKGSYIEIGPDGAIQVRSEDNHFRVTLKDDNLYAEGNINITAKNDVSILSEKGSIKIKAKDKIELEAESITANGKPVI